MELFAMEYVLRVAEYGNFSHAAQACHVGQPALSQQIAKLERELGVPLFTRGSRGASLTQAGTQFVQRAREILALSRTLEEEMHAFAHTEKGTLTVGAITSLECVSFSAMLSSFIRNHPLIRLDLREGGTYDLCRSLEERSLDIAFVNRPLHSCPSSLVFRHLGEDTYMAVLRRDHPLATQDRIRLADLQNDSFLFQHPSQVASELLLQACRQAGFDPKIVCRCASPSAAFSLVQGGLGIAFLPSEETKKNEAEDVICLPLEEPVKKEVGILYRKDAASPLVSAMVRHAVSFCL